MSAGIAVVAIGKIEARLMACLREGIEGTFHETCILGDPLPAPEFAFVPARKQYFASAVIGRLDRGSAGRVLGVVDLDLFASGLNFVFGQADPPGRRAVIALPRLRESFYGRGQNEALFLERVLKEAIHELGHTYGLGHCGSRSCIMAFSNSLLDTDIKNREFCPKCARQLHV